jgi:hypothetical protein
VVDFDDFCDKHWCVNSLRRLKDRYPNFKVTLFTIPNKVSMKFLRVIRGWGWIELAVHGFNHNPNDEMMNLSKDQIIDKLRRIDFNIYEKGFKAPGWYIHEGVVEACNELGLWIALHGDHDRELASKCAYGYYISREEGGSWHGHAHLDDCNNYIVDDLPLLLKKWPERQDFAFVSESLRHGASSSQRG